MRTTVNPIIHPSRAYPRQTKGEQILKSKCPACGLNNIEMVIEHHNGLLKRISTCVNCKTIWTTRTARVKVRYKQEFYK